MLDRQTNFFLRIEIRLKGFACYYLNFKQASIQIRNYYIQVKEGTVSMALKIKKYLRI